MQNQQTGVPSRVLGCVWSNRILLLAVAGVLFLTLYPFRFDFHSVLPEGTSPLLLGRTSKSYRIKNAFLNVLLFLPLGFGLSEKLRGRGKSRGFTLVLAITAGAFFSYGIELLQIYIPERDSGWEDVFANASGAAVGLILYELLGKLMLQSLSSCEFFVETLLTRWRALVVVLVYFGLWFAASSLLQRKTRLSNWRADAQLVLGNDSSGKYPWKGRIGAVQIWDRALGNEAAQKLSSGQEVDADNLVVNYEFAAGSPFLNQKKISPELVWIPRPPATSEPGPLALNGLSWLGTKGAVPDLVAMLQNTNQFTVRLICTPDGAGSDGRIFSISQVSGFADLTLRQEGADLVFWFRNPLSVSHAILTWAFPNFFTVGRTRDILLSYDGSNLSLFVDGIRKPLTYRLGPGTGLAKFLRLVRPSELEGYNYIYYILVFCPVGALLGIAARNLSPLRFSASLWVAIGLLVPPFLLDWILASTSGRSFSLPYIGLSALLAVGGFLWINSDRHKSLTV